MNKLRPSDFGSYWYEISKELSEIDMNSEISMIPIRSNASSTLYSVSLVGANNYPLKGYLSIPNKEGRFPAIYFAPRNASVLEIIPQGMSTNVRDQFVIFSLACRGMRNSDNPHVSMYPGQLTENVDSVEGYIYRGIVADTLRGLDFIITRPEMDRTTRLNTPKRFSPTTRRSSQESRTTGPWLPLWRRESATLGSSVSFEPSSSSLVFLSAPTFVRPDRDSAAAPACPIFLPRPSRCRCLLRPSQRRCPRPPRLRPIPLWLRPSPLPPPIFLSKFRQLHSYDSFMMKL